MIVLFSGLKDASWQLAVPVLGQQMVFGRLIRGDVVTALDYAVPAAIAFVIAAVCLAGVTRLLGEERIVFGRG